MNSTPNAETENSTANSRYFVRFWAVIALVAAAWVGVIVWLHSHNPRLLPSWHGFLHSGIASVFTSDFSLPPENPFFAGEPLSYYWVYHFLGFSVSKWFATDLLHAFRLIALASLITLMIAGGLIGRKALGSTLAGVMIGYLALSGVNPMGPVFAAGKHLAKGAPIVSSVDAAAEVENVFVSNALADSLMTHPLIGALYIGSDWRHGQNLAWFVDVSSRTPALALTIVMLFLVLGTRPSPWRCACAFLVSALTTAINPLIGLMVGGSLFGASALVLLGDRIAQHQPVSEWTSILRSPHLAIPGLFLAGVFAAAPTYYHIFQINQSAAGFSPVSYAWLKAAATSANYLILAPLAALGAWRARGPFDGEIRTMATAGFLLLVALVVFHLEQGNEHNLANVAQCLLAVPATSCIFSALRRPIGEAPRATVPFCIAIAVFLPMSIATLWSFHGRPAIPLEFQGELLRRVPRDGPLESFYSWAREQTPRDAVFVSDPSRPVKMSGNVAELPAFAFRSLFIDRESYLTTPYPDAPTRTRIAENLARGIHLADADAAYLREFHRPLYLVTYRADQSPRLKSLIAQHGEPAFAKGFVAVFGLQVNDLADSKE